MSAAVDGLMNVAVFGDLSGHLEPLLGALDELGVDLATACVPDGLVIVQVGDLVHHGPDGDSIVALVDRLLHQNPGRWAQLLGNHEAQHVAGHDVGAGPVPKRRLVWPERAWA